MILFINEEAAYRYWVTHHRDGFVLDGRHRPRWRKITLHRAICPSVRQAPTKRTHWTTGESFKACSLDKQEIVDWVEHELGLPCERCEECLPDGESPFEPRQHRQLSPLATDILDYVLEVAMMHLEPDSLPYHLTVGAIAACMGKSVGPIAPTLKRLVEEGYLISDTPPEGKNVFRPQQVVFPTREALRVLPYYNKLPDEFLQADLDKLR
jgi:hypothetical protein